MDVFIDIENYSHGDSPTNLTITFSTATNTTAAAQRHRLNTKGETMAHVIRHNHLYRGAARFRSLDSDERNGYLKDVAAIDAQQKSMELLTFSCSRGSS